jgi:hypothetical protein
MDVCPPTPSVSVRRQQQQQQQVYMQLDFLATRPWQRICMHLRLSPRPSLALSCSVAQCYEWRLILGHTIPYCIGVHAPVLLNAKVNPSPPNFLVRRAADRWAHTAAKHGLMCSHGIADMALSFQHHYRTVFIAIWLRNICPRQRCCLMQLAADDCYAGSQWPLRRITSWEHWARDGLLSKDPHGSKIPAALSLDAPSWNSSRTALRGSASHETTWPAACLIPASRK